MSGGVRKVKMANLQTAKQKFEKAQLKMFKARIQLDKLESERKIMTLDEYLKLLKECPAEELEFKVGFWDTSCYLLVNANYGKMIDGLESRGFKRLYWRWESSPGWSEKDKDTKFGGYGIRGFSSITFDNHSKTKLIVNQNVDNYSTYGHLGDTTYQMRNHNITILLAPIKSVHTAGQKIESMDDMRRVALNVLDYVQEQKYPFCIPRELIYSPHREK